MVYAAGENTMQTSQLVGIWKLKSNAGKPPAEYGVKTALIEFKADGTFVEATEGLSPVPGFVPERIYRLKGTWKLDENILERAVQGYWQNRKRAWPEGSFAEGTSPTITGEEMVAIDGDTLEFAAGQAYGIFVYKRVNTS
jgi:hypothetical protein